MFFALLKLIVMSLWASPCETYIDCLLVLAAPHVPSPYYTPVSAISLKLGESCEYYGPMLLRLTFNLLLYLIVGGCSSYLLTSNSSLWVNWVFSVIIGVSIFSSSMGSGSLLSLQLARFYWAVERFELRWRERAESLEEWFRKVLRVGFYIDCPITNNNIFR